MKKYFGFAFIILLSIAFGTSEKEEVYPEDLAGKKALLKENQTKLNELQAIVSKLQEEIETLDPNAKPKRQLVTYRTLEKKDFQNFVEVQATIVADDMAMASSETGGRLKTLTVDEGSYVKKGQLIGTVDLETIEKRKAELETGLSLARDVYQRRKRLWDQNIGSEIEFLQAKNQVEQLEKSMETLKYEQTKANIYAPMSGTVERKMLDAGEMTGPGTPILQIINYGKVKVTANVSEEYLKNVRRGDRVTVKFPALGEEKQVRISDIGRMINPNNRTFPVEIAMSNPGNKYKPNLLATVMVKDFEMKDVIVLPLSLVQEEISGSKFVYIKANDAKKGEIAKKVYVETGESYEGEVIVTSGLTGEEEVIDRGVTNVNNGTLIELATK